MLRTSGLNVCKTCCSTVRRLDIVSVRRPLTSGAAAEGRRQLHHCDGSGSHVGSNACRVLRSPRLGQQTRSFRCAQKSAGQPWIPDVASLGSRCMLALPHIHGKVTVTPNASRSRSTTCMALKTGIVGLPNVGKVSCRAQLSRTLEPCPLKGGGRAPAEWVTRS